MADSRFYSTAGPFGLQKLADIGSAELRLPITKVADSFIDVAALHEATNEHISFIDNRKYIQQFENTSAGAIVAPS